MKLGDDLKGDKAEEISAHWLTNTHLFVPVFRAFSYQIDHDFIISET
jgi:hypothetical protein